MKSIQIREKHGITHQNPMFCQVFFPFNPLFRPEAHLETFVSRKNTMFR